MKRLLPTLTALLLAVAATMALPASSRAVLAGNELACATGTAELGVEYADLITPKIADACIANERGYCDLEEADIADDHTDFASGITNRCRQVPSSFEGFCGGQPIAEIAECVADSYDAAARMVADSSVGGGLAPPRVVIIEKLVPIRCSKQGQPCFGTGITGCCRGLVCRVRSVLVGGQFLFVPTCIPGDGGIVYGSPAGAFLNTSRSLLR